MQFVALCDYLITIAPTDEGIYIFISSLPQFLLFSAG